MLTQNVRASFDVTKSVKFLVGVWLTVAVFAPDMSAAQSSIPVRELSPPNATSTQKFGSILGVRELPGGDVIVNDGRRRQLLMLNSQLATQRVLLDSVPVDGKGYGPRAAPIIAFSTDSTFFVDGASGTLLVLSPTGAVVRVASAPQPRDLRSLTSALSGTDAKGNLLYLGSGPMKSDPRAPGDLFPADSNPVVRANFESRTVDTLGRVRSRVTSRTESKKVGDTYVSTNFSNPLPVFDEWAPLSDGTIAIVRGHDYHVDLIKPDGTHQVGPKLAFDWKRLSEGDKQALLDSARAVREAREKDPNATPMRASSAALQAASQGGPPVTKANTPQDTEREVGIAEIPDYWPPLRQGAVKADADGNIWILPTTSAQSSNGELVYDVVNNEGVMTHRVRVPLGRSIAGFGKGGVVYLMYRDADPKVGWTFERTKIR
ncbi:MAG: hypothetical protein H7Z40_19495 [Phycisphaerae bacterium]|nr:hypothetical protein [Gemmatimonadaceae bacterium]